MTEIDIDDYTLPEYITMYIIGKGPAYRSQIIREAINEFGDMIEHGPYIYGEFSDDIYEAVERLCWDGVAKYVSRNGRITLTDYGGKYLHEFINGGAFEDEDWEKASGRMTI